MTMAVPTTMGATITTTAGPLAAASPAQLHLLSIQQAATQRIQAQLVQQAMAAHAQAMGLQMGQLPQMQMQQLLQQQFAVAAAAAAAGGGGIPVMATAMPTVATMPGGMGMNVPDMHVNEEGGGGQKKEEEQQGTGVVTEQNE